jgi:hypothetical protein
VNAAFLLVTTAWLAGDVPATPTASACSGGCDTCARHHFRERLRGLFQRNDCCETRRHDCCDSGHRWRGWCHGHHQCGHRCHQHCDRHWGHRCNHDTCDSCDRGGLFGRLRGLFNRRNDHGCCGGTTVVPRAGETIPTPPKKMPSPTGKEPPAKEVRIDTPPGLAPAIPAIQQAPAVDPRAEPADNRNPF